MDTDRKLKDEYLIRYTEPGDVKYVREWLSQPSTRRWFPMTDQVEIDDSATRWVSFCRYKCSLTATHEGIPCGIATLYLQPYRSLAHQCALGIIVHEDYRGAGIGELLLSSIMDLAKHTFHIELLHLEVFGENPAMRLYQRMGFREFGRQTRWKKNSQGLYSTRVFMERIL
jgi:putative acetyltransferase